MSKPFEDPWWTKLYTWFRRWGWVPVAVILAVLGVLVGVLAFRRDKDGKIIINPLRDVRAAVEENNERIDTEIAEAAVRRDDAIAKIEREHLETIDKLNTSQQRRYDKLMRNPDKLSAWLTRLANE